MNKLIYLSTGQQAELISELPNNQYLVDPIVSYQDEHTGEWFDLPSSGLIKVDKVFTKPPIDKISKDITDLNNKKTELSKSIDELSKELRELNRSLEKSNKESQDLAKWRVDLSKFKSAKTIVFFVKNIVQPVIIDRLKIKYDARWELTFKINVLTGTKVEYAQGRYCDYDNEYRKYHDVSAIDTDYGYLFDLSEDEITRITNERSEGMDLHNLHYMNKAENVPAIYQTERIKKHIEDAKETSRLSNIKFKKEQIEKLKQEIEAIS